MGGSSFSPKPPSSVGSVSSSGSVSSVAFVASVGFVPLPGGVLDPEGLVLSLGAGGLVTIGVSPSGSSLSVASGKVVPTGVSVPAAVSIVVSSCGSVCLPFCFSVCFVGSVVSFPVSPLWRTKKTNSAAKTAINNTATIINIFLFIASFFALEQAPKCLLLCFTV